jgi:hypothetical protein
MIRVPFAARTHTLSAVDEVTEDISASFASIVLPHLDDAYLLALCLTKNLGEPADGNGRRQDGFASQAAMTAHMDLANRLAQTQRAEPSVVSVESESSAENVPRKTWE